MNDKKILVTGGTGSIGSEIVKQLISQNPKKIVVFCRDESDSFFMKRELSNPIVDFVIGDIRSYSSLRRIFQQGIDIVIHAAALKHVSLCEENPIEAVKTNVFGTQNIIDLANIFEIDSVLTISTDKAVNPSSIMGSTKYIAETITIKGNQYEGKTKFFCVRFGNVLGSRGSVFPALYKSIIEKGQIEVTDLDVTRFLMPISDAVKLVLDSFDYSNGGEIFVMKMKSIKLETIVTSFKNELNDKYPFKIKVLGLQSGEKKHEELLTISELSRTWDIGDFYVISPKTSLWNSSLLKDFRKTEVVDYNSSKGDFLTLEESTLLVKEYITNFKLAD